MEKPIYATDGTNYLLRGKQVAQIGTIYPQRFIVKNGRFTRSVLVEFDYEGKGFKDYFVFEDGVLIANNIAMGNQPDVVIQAYQECVSGKKPVELNVFLNVVVSAYLMQALGFTD